MTKEVWIRSIGTTVGRKTVDNHEQAASYRKEAEFVHSRLGAIELPEASPDETAISLAKEACIASIQKGNVDPSDIGMLIFVSQNPDFGGLPHNSAVLQGELGLPTSAVCFDVGLGCSGFVYGLSIVDAMLRSLNTEHALLVTSDQYRKHLLPGDGNTQLLFGDGAAATLISSEPGDGFCYRGARLGTDGTKFKGLMRASDGISMSGRAIYGFSRKVVPAEISKFLDQSGLTKDDINCFLLHQGSRAIVEEIANELRLPPGKVPIMLEKTGNTVSSSIPFMLETLLHHPSAKRVLLAGFGVGLSWGIALLER